MQAGHATTLSEKEIPLEELRTVVKEIRRTVGKLGAII
jgi:hypothetical protein